MGKTQTGKIIVIVAPSGTGKSTLIQRLKAAFPMIDESVSDTTRPIRPGEEHGKNYFYISKAEFESKIKADRYLEWANVHGNYYGTSVDFVEQGLAEGKVLLFDLDVQGCDSVRLRFPEAKIVFIEPPSLEELEKRLRGRGTESEDIIRLRINNAKKELERKSDYDYLVLNDDIDKAYERLYKVFKEIIEEEA